MPLVAGDRVNLTDHNDPRSLSKCRLGWTQIVMIVIMGYEFGEREVF